MKINSNKYNSSNYLYNYYLQSKKYAYNAHKSTDLKDKNIASYYQQKDNTEIADQINKQDSYSLPESSNISKASKQLTHKKSGSIPNTLKKTSKNASGSLDPFLTLEKLYKISSKAKKARKHCTPG
jgi:hypothetical protein